MLVEAGTRCCWGELYLAFNFFVTPGLAPGVLCNLVSDARLKATAIRFSFVGALKDAALLVFCSFMP